MSEKRDDENIELKCEALCPWDQSRPSIYQTLKEQAFEVSSKTNLWGGPRYFPPPLLDTAQDNRDQHFGEEWKTRRDALGGKILAALKDRTKPLIAETYKEVCYIGKDEIFTRDIINQALDQSAVDNSAVLRVLLWIIRCAPDQTAIVMALELLTTFARVVPLDIVEVLGPHRPFASRVQSLLTRVKFPDETSKENLTFKIANALCVGDRFDFIERLLGTDNPAAKRLILRMYYGDSQDPSDLPEEAKQAAIAGGLGEALAEEIIDHPLLLGAINIFNDLRRQDFEAILSDFPDYSDMLLNLLRHLEAHVLSLESLYNVTDIYEELGYLEKVDPKDMERVWIGNALQPTLARLKNVFEKPEHRALVEKILVDPVGQGYDYDMAVWITDIGWGEDPWGKWFSAVKAGRTDLLGYACFSVKTEDQMYAIAHWATDALGLNNSGVADTSLATKPELEDLDDLIKTLCQFPGIGKSLILAGLRSDNRYNRRAAGKVLATWESSSWPMDAMPLLERTLKTEKDVETCKQLKAAVANGSKES